MDYAFDPRTLRPSATGRSSTTLADMFSNEAPNDRGEHDMIMRYLTQPRRDAGPAARRAEAGMFPGPRGDELEQRRSFFGPGGDLGTAISSQNPSGGSVGTQSHAMEQQRRYGAPMPYSRDGGGEMQQPPALMRLMAHLFGGGR